MKNQPLSHKLLTYIGYCLPRAKFCYSYQNLNQALNKTSRQKYQISTLHKEFSNLKKTGFIEFKTRYRKPIPVLSQEGKLVIKTKLSFKRFDDWDRKWRVVLFDIPESTRTERLLLRTELGRLGFGALQKSAYFSPFPLLGVLSRFATNLGIRQYLSLMEVEKLEDEKKMVEKAWNLKNINEGYKKFLKKSHLLLQTQGSQLFWPLLAKELESEFAQIYDDDPHLPAKLLPKSWAGLEAYQVFKEISNSY